MWSLWPGELLGPEVGNLASILTEHTSAAEACSFGFWSGWGHLDGPVAEAESFSSAIGQCPTIWWPGDRAWLVHTHNEATSTYLGGSRALVDRLVGEQVMESFEVQTDTLVAW
jgi:hypothetical protein